MRTLVYKFGLRPPTENADLVEQQFRLSHAYRNDLIAIERARRAALRALLDTPEIRTGEEALRAAARTERKEMLRKVRGLRAERLETLRCEGGSWRVRAEDAEQYPYSPLFEDARINLLDRVLRKDAYNHHGALGLYWGVRSVITASADQARRMALYGDDGHTPAEPSHVPWHRAVRQIAVQLQGGLPTPEALASEGTQARLTLRTGARRHADSCDATLALRVGSVGRHPVWATWPIAVHRHVPDMARWKWVKVTCRREGPWERWSCDVVVEIAGSHPRELDLGLAGTLAVECVWDKPGENIVVARWRDTLGHAGFFELPSRIASGIRKPDGIRSIRDRMLKGDKESRLPGMRDVLARMLREDPEAKPLWLARAAATMHLWESPAPFHDLVKHWRRERCDVARPAYDYLQEWEFRDAHLWEYETGARQNALRWRKDWYRKLAAKWARTYRHVIVDDRVLSREARWGEESEVRFTAAPAELRDAVRKAFGGNVSEHPVREEVAEEDERDWCERAIAAHLLGVSRHAKKTNKNMGEKSNAWEARKAGARLGGSKRGTARKADGKAAE